jgi:4,5-dihydroxyphthalate decarboxylase
MTVELSLGISSNPRTWPVIDGRAQAAAVAFHTNVLHPGELFWRQLHFGDFDVAEMSMSSLMMAQARGDDRWVGLPIFTTRNFFHTLILVRRDAGIASPSDLLGKRVGVPEYQQTAALWSRGVLQHEFGVSPTQMEFWMERLPSHSHAGAVGFQPPPGITIHQIPADKSIGSMMLSGELHATLLYLYAPKPTLTDRSVVDLANHPDIVPLFPDPAAEGARYQKKTGFYHINHGMVIRRTLLEKHPWLALNILKAFRQANDIADREREEHVAYHVATGRLSSAARDALRERFVHHGVKSNRRVLETAAQYSFEQGLTPRLMQLEEIFAHSMLEE